MKGNRVKEVLFCVVAVMAACLLGMAAVQANDFANPANDNYATYQNISQAPEVPAVERVVAIDLDRLQSDYTASPYDQKGAAAQLASYPRPGRVGTAPSVLTVPVSATVTRTRTMTINRVEAVPSTCGPAACAPALPPPPQACAPAACAPAATGERFIRQRPARLRNAVAALRGR